MVQEQSTSRLKPAAENTASCSRSPEQQQSKRGQSQSQTELRGGAEKVAVGAWTSSRMIVGRDLQLGAERIAARAHSRASMGRVLEWE
ncbi:hypothetical protein chiPu_0018359 [Chiloscyllium punctatum]|uniref:Uncharacterized protein n=1 Tax=Chiloscyllium punctatum TaxID=137246 RepID=A0A401RMM2_CHIPU|nr:hypothetical protein [Chiloscyllium punctatum]